MKLQPRRKKTRYFRKDYAPARAALQNSKKKTTKPKITNNSHATAKNLTVKTKKLAQNTAKAAKNLSKNLSAKINKSTQKLHTKSSARANQKSSSRKSKREPFTWRERTLLSMIGTTAGMIAIALIFTSVFDPVTRSERELEKLANSYYIEYLYPVTLGKYLNDPSTILADYVNQGLPNVRLRQLLLYNNGKHANSLEVFSNRYYECDTNQTYIRYYPVEPYGPRDFTVQYSTSCEKVADAD